MSDKRARGCGRRGREKEKAETTLREIST